MHKTIYLAGGCFWGVEKYFENYPGVVATRVGYANGFTAHPTYEAVCSGNTGFAETVKVDYDPTRTSLAEILVAYYDIIDPTVLNRQGNDEGNQYRTGIYYEDSADLKIIEGVTEEVGHKYLKPIVTEIQPLVTFYDAETYHQKYLCKNPGGYCHIPAEKLRA